MPGAGQWLVTALEPVSRRAEELGLPMEAAMQTRVVDGQSKIRVPPEDPQYELKRVWLTKEEEKGIIMDFPTRGSGRSATSRIHVHPSFGGWGYYQAVNKKFARATLEELKDAEEPLVLIQDYHCALLPRLIKEERPDARVAFSGIFLGESRILQHLPWQRELLHGMLGADLIGFHIQFPL